MECKRCGNKDPKYFYLGTRGWYCRKCVKFKRQILDEESKPFEYEVDKENSEYNFDYPLTKYQIDVSNKTLEYLLSGYDILLNCVCGSGKTEIVVKSISYYLSLGLKVCYAISRKEVVKELTIRFSEIFRNANVVGIYGGHSEIVYGDLIVCTTHQLFRYFNTFDLLILDEVDAFPLSGNNELMNIALRSAKGRIVFSTATINSFITNVLNKRKYKELNLFVRPSLKPLIVPEVIYGVRILLLIRLKRIMSNMDKQCIIFVTSRKQCIRLYRLFKHWFNCCYVYAGMEKESENINDFKSGKYQFIFSTTVLERGITIKDINVIILKFNDYVFNEENLIQMLGRVGRNFNNPYGKSYILTTRKSKVVDNAIENITEANNNYEMSLL